VPASRVHWVKSIFSPHPLQVCSFSNSSEKISFSFPQFGHLHVKAFKSLNCSHPGQCWGVVMINLLIIQSFHDSIDSPAKQAGLKKENSCSTKLFCYTKKRPASYLFPFHNPGPFSSLRPMRRISALTAR
jgi:hypothetical protein